MKTYMVYKIYCITDNYHIGLPVNQWGDADYQYDEFDTIDDAVAEISRRKDRRELVILPTVVTRADYD